MSLQQKIRSDMTEAMKAKDETRLSVLRGLLTSFTNENVSKKRKPDEPLSDDEVMVLIQRAAKQRKDSIAQFKKGGRDDLAKAEEAELIIIQGYLPQMMSREEILEVAKKKKQEMNIEDESQKGILMGAIMSELKGKADGAEVRDVVESLFKLKSKLW